MALLRYENMNPLGQLQRELSRLFDDRSSVVTSDWSPAVDIKEEPDRFVLYADISGVKAEDIDITMESGVLTIRGERVLENAEDRKQYKHVERSYGSFYRRFGLPDTADAQGISAKSREGVLEIVIPKLERVQPRKIKVDSQAS